MDLPVRIRRESDTRYAAAGNARAVHWILAYFTQLLLELDHANASNPSTRPSFSLKQVTSSYNIPQLVKMERYSSEDDGAVDAPLAEGALKPPPVGRAMNDSDEDEESAGRRPLMQMLAALSPQDCSECILFERRGASARPSPRLREVTVAGTGARGKPSKKHNLIPIER